MCIYIWTPSMFGWLEYHAITEYAELDVTHKDHES